MYKGISSYCKYDTLFFEVICTKILNLPEHIEAATRGVLWKRLLVILQYSQENICVGVSVE